MPSLKFIGAHVSAAGGVQNAPINAHVIGANAFALFTKNQRQWTAKPLLENEIISFKENLEKYNFSPLSVLPHDSYLINLGNADEVKRKQSLDAFIDEIRRCEQLGLHLLNFHPGSHLNEIAEEACLNHIATSINVALLETNSIRLVIENTAGQGSNLGFKFEHLAYLISCIKDTSRIGICLDTCHTYSAGYDLATSEACQDTFSKFDSIVGLRHLCAMHLNDDLKAFNSRVDRHAPLGDGTLGIAPFQWIMKQDIFNNMPLILETPDETRWESEIAMLRSFIPNT